jgi:transcriptional regulator with XRE-family HTH domain
MTLTGVQRDKIIDALLENRKQYDGSDSAFAKMHGINPAVYGRLKAGEREKVISSDLLLTIGRRLGVALRDGDEWLTVETETYKYISAQLAYCQQFSESRILVDMAGIGKSASAKHYRLHNRNVYYIDCSQVKGKADFVRELARVIGVAPYGRINDLINDTIYAIGMVDRPLIIVDEAGDLNYQAWLEIKRYWNATEGLCGWYMMGADGLKDKIERHLRGHKVGYQEIFDRFGHKFNTALPQEPQNKPMYLRAEYELVARANLKNKQLVAQVVSTAMGPVKAGGIQGLRRLKAEVLKANRAA